MIRKRRTQDAPSFKPGWIAPCAHRPGEASQNCQFEVPMSGAGGATAMVAIQFTVLPGRSVRRSHHAVAARIAGIPLVCVS
jgi:hypothetical protein